MKYELDQSYDFKVLPGGSEEDFFTLEVEGPKGLAQVPLKKFAFQRQPGYKMPATLNCRVKNFDENGIPVLSPNIATYVHTLYESTYSRGDSFECEVVIVPERPSEEPYMIADRNGIFFRLDEPEGMLAKGQKVRCKFNKLTPRYFSILRIDDGARLQFFTPEAISEGIEIDHRLWDFFERHLGKLDDFEGARLELDAQNPLWVLTTARVIVRHLPEWFLQGNLKKHNAVYRRLIDNFRSALLYLLEGSNFLNAAAPEQRRVLQQQLTELVDGLEPYEIVLRLIRHDEEDAFVEGLLDKLRKSGYLYHPARRFAVLMLIFRRHPDKVANYLGRIFDSIFGRDLENWKREPFRSAFVEQFEMYVCQTRREIDPLPLAESREQKARIETVVNAIALQILLADKDINLDRSWSLFYRYVALLRPVKTEDLLTKSFMSLMGIDVHTRLTYGQLKEPMMMMTQATVMPAGDIFSRLTTTHRYTGTNVDISISRDGLRLNPAGRRDITERAIPEGLMPWLKPQINVNGVHSLTGPRLRKLPEHNVWWHDIESNLFEVKPSKVEAEPPVETVNTRQRATEGDQVYIVIDRVSEPYSNNPTFHCHIADEEYADGIGILQRDKIVGYNLKQPPMRAFCDSDGSPLGFLATVDHVNNNGSYVFSLLEEVDRYIEETFNFEDEFVAVVTGNAERDYSAISSVGIGLYLERDNVDEYRMGDIVTFKLNNIGTQGQIKGYITGMADSTEAFGKSEAFTTLIQAIGESGATETESETTAEEATAVSEEVVRDIDEILTTDQLREIIDLIHLKAIAETDLIKAYDYLRLARIIALVLADDILAEKLLTHAALLSQHQFFATNSRIDPEKLEELQARSNDDPFLRMIYHRLEMVSWLGRQERSEQLYETVNNPSNELEGTIARMVLAYNMLHTDSGDTTISADIKQKIMEKLNVNNETRQGKYYGSESKYLEFKTSIVYPATAPGEEMREDPQTQQFHILSRIAGLLNANGGRLYLGVNNDGYEVGLHDDFKYFERHNAYAKQYSFKVKNLDQLTVFLEELINQHFDRKVGRKIEVSIDPEAEKGVVMFNVQQSLVPVFLDGRLFVRQSGQATREYRGKDIEEFVAERQMLLAEQTHKLAILTAPEPMSEPEAELADDISESEVEESKPVETTQPAVKTIHTSCWKPNVLHDYDEGYEETYGYLYFMEDNKLVFSRQDLYRETGCEGCLLALAIPHEAAQAQLVIAYDNERAMRVPLQEIYEKGENVSLSLYDGAEPIFAAIAGRDDMLMCVGADSGGSLWRRATKLAQIEQTHLTGEPKRFHDAPIHHTVAYEIVNAGAAETFADCFADKLGSKRFGATLRVKENAHNYELKIKETFEKCAPQN